MSASNYYINPNFPHHMNLTVIVPENKGRIVYVKKDFTPYSVSRSTKVLVNPNFNHKIHINPNFNKNNVSVQSTKNVYINPLVFKSANLNSQTESPRKEPLPTCPINLAMLKSTNVATSNTPPSSKRITPSEHSKIKEVQLNIHSRVITQFSMKLKETEKPSVVTQYKKINRTRESLKPNLSRYTKINQCASTLKPIVCTKNKLILKQTAKKSIFSKYKIVHKEAHKFSVGLHASNRVLFVKNKFKLDRRVNRTKVGSKSASKFKIDRRTDNKKTSKHKLTSKMYLLNLDLKHDIIKRRNVGSILKLHGDIFKLGVDGIVMKLIYKNPLNNRKMNRINYKGHIFMRQDATTFVKVKAKVLKGNMMKINKKLLKKINFPCQVFRHTGRCIRLEKGVCNRSHDKKEISICTKFLQGACINKQCLLSHNVSPEKMPTCKFFLEGLCHNEDCQYLHVKLSKTAAICRMFLRGYCEKGVNCTNRHQFLCPTFESQGKCRKNCPYPHGEVVRKDTFKFINKIARSTSKIDKRCKDDKVQKKVELPTSEPLNVRYFDAVTNCDEQKDDSAVSNRPKLGCLPAFIPL